MDETKLTGEQWSIIYEKLLGLRILDPDGFDRVNFEQSFKIELYTMKEFEEKLIVCTLDYIYPSSMWSGWGVGKHE